MSLAAQLGVALTRLRGDRPRARVAEAAGVAPNTLGEVEHGKANPTLARVEQLAAIYGAEVTITVTPKGPPA